MEAGCTQDPSKIRLALLFYLACLCLQGDAICTAGIHVPKLAMLFLARGGMPLEDIWKPWFSSVGGLVPTNLVKEQFCDSHDVAAVHSLECDLMNPNEPVLNQQVLFSVYVHSSRLNFTDFAPTSVFSGTLISSQGKAAWGDTTPAVRLLLVESLKDYMNHMFVLLSDSDIPLYPASMTYLQLIQETRSRLDGCHAYDMVNINRYTCAMAEDGIDLHHWRKSNLFMLLIRKHAELFRDDKQIYQSFQDKCSGVLVDEAIQQFRGCLTDEHYYGSFMAAKGLSHETDCFGVVTLANFTTSFRGHPQTYNHTHVHPGILSDLRKPLGWMPKANCANETVFQSLKGAFLKFPLQGDQIDCPHMQHSKEPVSMESWCQMFYRKFDPSVVPGMLRIMTKGHHPDNILVDQAWLA